MKFIAQLALLLLSIGSAVAQEPPQAPMADWKILSPAPGAILTSPVPWVDVYARVPMQSSVRIEVVRLDKSGAGEVLWVEATGGPIVSQRFQKNGDMLPPGEYTASLFNMADAKQIADSIKFTIVAQEKPRSFPSITNPIDGTVYVVDDSGVAPVSIGGVAGSLVWIVLYQDGEYATTTEVASDGPPNYRYSTDFNLPAGSYVARAFSINPADLLASASDTVTFTVIEIPVIAPPEPAPAPDPSGVDADSQVIR